MPRRKAKARAALRRERKRRGEPEEPLARDSGSEYSPGESSDTESDAESISDQDTDRIGGRDLEDPLAGLSSSSESETDDDDSWYTAGHELYAVFRKNAWQVRRVCPCTTTHVPQRRIQFQVPENVTRKRKRPDVETASSSEPPPRKKILQHTYELNSATTMWRWKQAAKSSGRLTDLYGFSVSLEAMSGTSERLTLYHRFGLFHDHSCLGQLMKSTPSQSCVGREQAAPVLRATR